MSTAALPNPIRFPVRSLRSAEAREAPAQWPDGGPVNLTTYRISRGQHGRTLQMLGHAAEHLVNSRRFRITETNDGDHDAVRILMRLSSQVFREYAESVRVRRPVEDFVMGRLARLFE